MVGVRCSDCVAKSCSELGVVTSIISSLRLLWGSVLTAVLFIGFLVVGFFLFDSGYVMDMLYPLLTLPLVFGGNMVSQVIIERTDKRFVRDLFGRYVSPEVANEILSLADSELNMGKHRHLLLLALRSGEDWLYNPPADCATTPGCILVVMTTPEDRAALEKFFQTA